MKNDYIIGDTKISIPPTILFSVMGYMDDVRRAVTMDVKRPGDCVYVVGMTYDELGGSEWFAHHGVVGNTVPRVHAGAAMRRYRTVSALMAEGVIASCHDCSDGGLGVALAETAFAGGWGMKIDLGRVPREGVSRDDHLLFSESQSRFVITVHPDKAHVFEARMAEDIMARIGTVRNDESFVVIGMNGQSLIDESIALLKEAWQRPLAF